MNSRNSSKAHLSQGLGLKHGDGLHFRLSERAKFPRSFQHPSFLRAAYGHSRMRQSLALSFQRQGRIWHGRSASRGVQRRRQGRLLPQFSLLPCRQPRILPALQLSEN